MSEVPHRSVFGIFQALDELSLSMFERLLRGAKWTKKCASKLHQQYRYDIQVLTASVLKDLSLQDE